MKQMKTSKALFAGAAVAAGALVWAASTYGAQLASGGIPIDGDDIAGVVTGASGPEDGGSPLAGLTCAERRRWLESMIAIEPIKYVGLASPMPLLLQSGRQDNLVPPRDAERLHVAVGDPRTIRWYDAGHGLTAEASRDRLSWLQQWLGMRAPAF